MERLDPKLIAIGVLSVIVMILLGMLYKNHKKLVPPCAVCPVCETTVCPTAPACPSVTACPSCGTPVVTTGGATTGAKTV